MNNVYFDGFNDREHMLEQFSCGPQLPDDAEVLFAAYGLEEEYCGGALVIYRHSGKLYEVNDSHCSCYGLENWVPEETDIEAIAIRELGSYYSVEAIAGLRAMIEKLRSET